MRLTMRRERIGLCCIHFTTQAILSSLVAARQPVRAARILSVSAGDWQTAFFAARIWPPHYIADVPCRIPRGSAEEKPWSWVRRSKAASMRRLTRTLPGAPLRNNAAAPSAFISMQAAEGTPAAAEAVILPPRRLCVAPMMDWTDRYDRYFLRRFSKDTWLLVQKLYTEMVTTGALIHGDQDRHLKFFKEEHPIALQLGGSDPDELAKCAAIAEGYGYDEINLNVGCPSERVSSGSFGACLMAEPELVRDCVAAMAAAVKVPITVKHRIGIDNMDSYEELLNFVSTVERGGCSTFIVHARKAILKGLSPKENREIPPLNYEFVYQLKRDLPHLELIINGGITDLQQAQAHLQGGKVDGVMIGRSAYHEPYRILASADAHIFGNMLGGYRKTRQEVVDEMVPFIEEQLAQGVSLNSMTRHMIGLFHGCQGGRKFRQYLSDNVHKKDSGVHTFLRAVQEVPEEVRYGTASSDNPIAGVKQAEI